MKIKTAFVTGSRAEYGLLYPVLKTFSKSEEFELYLIVTGLHLSPFFGLTKKNITSDGFKIDFEIPFQLDSDLQESLPISLGHGIIQFVNVFKTIKPHIVFVLGDRIEILAASLSATFLKIPVAHIHGGDNTSFKIPDTYVRHVVSKLSHIHFPATSKSKKNLIKMGEDGKRIYVVGNLGIYSLPDDYIPDYTLIKRKYNLFDEKDYVLLIYHPLPFDIENSIRELKLILKALYEFKLNILAIAPNNDPGGREIFNLLIKEKEMKKISLFPNFPYLEYISIMKSSKFIIGNSSSALYEAGLFKVPVINIGNRQSLRERGGYIYNANTLEEIKESISNLLNNRLPKFIPLPFKRVRGDLIIKRVIIKFFTKYSIEEIFNKTLSIR
ncbi:MAG: UDP-N-acetylglucosamine 2-epimerase [Candidatus Hydrothermales bacterium]